MCASQAKPGRRVPPRSLTLARRRSRFLANQQRRRRRPDGGGDPAAAIRLAGFGAALLVFVAVGAGFHGERVTTLAARLFSTLEPLARPLVFGLSGLELGAVAIVLAVFGVTLWRGFRR